MDINMPFMNGIEATIKLRTSHEERGIDLSKTTILMHSAI